MSELVHKKNLKISEFLYFCINLPKYQMIKNFPNTTLLCWIFSQYTNYKLNSNQIIPTFLMNKIEFLSQISVFSVSVSTIFQLNLISTKFYLKIEF